jgi:hypothetical protein
MSSKSNMYKIWRSKQHTGFCGTRVQVGKYSSLECSDEQCPNCGRREMAAHILICPNEDRMRHWLTQHMILANGSTKITSSCSSCVPSTRAMRVSPISLHPSRRIFLRSLSIRFSWTRNIWTASLAYWIPKYILMWGNKPFASLGTMSPKMRALAISQDKIGWRNFIEGCISTLFYFIQHYHLALSGSYLNRSDLTKSLISKLLHITHLQWIYHNFTLHDKLCRGTSTTNLSRTSDSPLKSWQKRPQMIYPRKASFYLK